MKQKIIVWIIASLILISAAISIGIAPAEKSINFAPNMQEELSYRVINNENRVLDLKIDAIGELAEYAQFAQTDIHLNEDEPEKTFTVKLSFPESLAPGERTLKVRIAESIPSLEVGENYVNARLELISKITVNVPYPEKYVSVNLEVDALKPDEPIKINAKIENLGRKDISNLKAEFGIYEQDTLLQQQSTEETSLLRTDEKELSAMFTLSNYTPGLYSAKAKISYDENSIELGKDFNVGEETISVLDYTKYFTQGKINKFDITVKNEWNRKIRDIYALIYIASFDSIKSIAYDLDPWQEKVLVSYWDTTSVPLGTYESTITIDYINRTTTKKGNVHVITEEEAEKRLEKSNTWLYVLLGAVILLLISLNVFVLLKKLGKTKKR